MLGGEELKTLASRRTLVLRREYTKKEVVLLELSTLTAPKAVHTPREAEGPEQSEGRYALFAPKDMESSKQ